MRYYCLLQNKNLYTIALLLSLPVLYEKPQDHH